jgi:3,4-dihydroxy-2-butanone 4-phosphate synthase
MTNKIRDMKMKTIIALLMCTCLAIAQDAKQTYEIPFDAKGNVIELSVANNSTLTAEGVKVEVTSVPQGIKFTEKMVTIPTLTAKEEQTASFGFSVEKTAVINKEQTLSFKITDKTG